MSSAIFQEIMEAGKVYRSVQVKYLSILMHAKDKQVPFRDLETYFLREAVKAGYYDGSEDTLSDAKRRDLNWWHNLDLFLGWVNRHYTSYDKKKSHMNAKRQSEVTKLRKKRKEEMKTLPKISENKVKKLMENPEAVGNIIKILKEYGYRIEEPDHRKAVVNEG